MDNVFFLPANPGVESPRQNDEKEKPDTGSRNFQYPLYKVGGNYFNRDCSAENGIFPTIAY